MTDEEINRKFEVVANHLASLAVGMQQLQEVQARAERLWERTEGSVRALLATAELQAGEIRELGEAVRTIDERQRQAEARVAALADAQRETDENVKALVNSVERYISGRNGQS
jgi:adenylosuccinate lyase